MSAPPDEHPFRLFRFDWGASPPTATPIDLDPSRGTYATVDDLAHPYEPTLEEMRDAADYIEAERAKYRWIEEDAAARLALAPDLPAKLARLGGR